MPLVKIPAIKAPTVSLYIRITDEKGRRRYERVRPRSPQPRGPRDNYAFLYYVPKMTWEQVGPDYNEAVRRRAAKEHELLQEARERSAQPDTTPKAPSSWEELPDVASVGHREPVDSVQCECQARHVKWRRVSENVSRLLLELCLEHLKGLVLHDSKALGQNWTNSAFRSLIRSAFFRLLTYGKSTRSRRTRFSSIPFRSRVSPSARSNCTPAFFHAACAAISVVSAWAR